MWTTFKIPDRNSRYAKDWDELAWGPCCTNVMLPQRNYWSLHSWRDSCVWGTFLAAEPPRKASGKATRENPACHFLWVLNAAHFCHPVWNHLITQSGRVVSYKTGMQTSQAKHINQATNKTTTCWKLFRIQGGYSVVTPNLRNSVLY